MGLLSISEVPPEFAPAAMPEQFEPSLLITIQPVGVTFATPVPISFPNIDALPPGTELDIWSLDPELGEFVTVGTGRLSADGQTIETISGGVRAADWHFALPPLAAPIADPVDNICPLGAQSVLSGSQTAVASGALTLTHTLGGYRSLGRSRGLDLVYNSLRAAPRPIISADTTILERSAVPKSIVAELRLAGAEQGQALHTATAGLDENRDERVRQAVQLDAGALPTGYHPYRLKIKSQFDRSAVSAFVSGGVLVGNERDSAFGAGWGLAGLERVVDRGDENLVLSDGDPSGLVTDYSYNADALVSQIRETPPADGGAVRATENTYDLAGRLIGSQLPEGRLLGFGYDAMDRLTESSDSLGQRIVHGYDAAGNRTATTDALDTTATIHYDALDRLTAVVYLDSAEDITLDYDSGPFGAGTPCGYSDEAGNTEMAYDACGNLLEETRSQGATDYSTR